MDVYKLIIATIAPIATFLAVTGIMSFVAWQNVFKIMGWPYIARMNLVIVIVMWVIALIPGGK